MLGKLLKSEFRATGRVMLPFLGGLLVLALAANLGIRLINGNAALTALGAIIVVIYFLALCAMGVVTLVLLVYRFYRSLLSDEGYLTFSLPAGIHTQLWSKLICSAVWIIVAFIALMLSIVLVTSPVELTRYVLSDMSGMFERFAEAYGIGAFELVSFVLEVLLLMLLASLAACLTFYASMSLGFGFSDHKVLYSVLVFIGIGIVTQIASVSLIAAVGVGLSSMPLDFVYRMDYLDYGHVFLLSMCALELIYCAALYAITAFSLKRRLNLP